MEATQRRRTHMNTRRVRPWQKINKKSVPSRFKRFLFLFVIAPDIIWAVCYKPAAYLSSNEKLSVSWQCLGGLCVTNYGSSWRMDAVNQCAEFGSQIDTRREEPAGRAGALIYNLIMITETGRTPHCEHRFPAPSSTKDVVNQGWSMVAGLSQSMYCLRDTTLCTLHLLQWLRFPALFGRRSMVHAFGSEDWAGSMDHSRGIFMRWGHQGNRDRKRSLGASSYRPRCRRWNLHTLSAFCCTTSAHPHSSCALTHQG